jgi:hypothetical protein
LHARAAMSSASSRPLVNNNASSSDDDGDDETNNDDNMEINDNARNNTVDNGLLSGNNLSSRQYNNLLLVLRLLCLHTGVCVHQKVESFLVNPFCDDNENPIYNPANSCGDSCWVCRTEPLKPAVAALSLPFSRSGLRSCLVDLFFHRQLTVDDRLLKSGKLTDVLVKYKNSDGITFQKIVFNRAAPTTAAVECRSLILRLFAARIIEPAVEDKKLYCTLALDNTATPYIHSDEAFVGINTTD